MSQAGIINIAGGGGGGSPIETITGNTGGPEAPIANNFNFLTANSTVIFAGSPGTETLDFGLSNLIIGSKPTPTNTNNVGLGQNALASLMSAGECTCIGAAAGRLLTTANNCTLIGDGAGSNITTSFQNTSLGADTLSSLTTGSGSNTALGFEVLSHLLTGTRNIGIGLSACDNYVGAESSNIIIGNIGVVSESNVIRIGTQGSGAGQQNIAFMAGITGVTAVGSPTAVSSTGQLSDLGFGTSTQVLTSNGAGVSPTWQPTATPAPTTLITKFTSGGTWTINPRTISVEFYVWGGGGGGGSGRCGVSNTSGGGSGGAGGNFVYLKTLASLLTASPYTITIGTGGTGGIAINAVTTNGNPGNPGNPTSVGTAVIATGGAAGLGGTTGAAAAVSSLFYGINALLNSSNSGSGAGSTPTASVFGWDTGGGGGAAYVATSARLGGAGGAITDPAGNVLVAGGLAGANTGATAGNGNSPTTASLLIGGTGGGGGGQDGTVTSGTGGNGATPGGGGGGGAGNLSSNASGAGGNGANGQIIIIEYF